MTCTHTTLDQIDVRTCTNPAIAFYTDGSIYAARCRCHHPDDRSLNLCWKEITRGEYEVAQVMEG